MSGRAVLTLNAGSSSLKFAVFEAGTARYRGQVARLGAPDATREPAEFTLRDAAGSAICREDWPGRDHAQALDQLLARLPEWDVTEVAAAGHRVVHGGTRFQSPVRVSAEVLTELEALCPLAPLHQPHNLAAIRAVARRHPGWPQVACFDTAFHATLPPVEQRLPLPREYFARGIKRYGFHGLSYESVVEQLARHDPPALTGRTIILHLGSGASGCALQAGRSMATTMGFSTLDGLMMSTRTGALDPGVLLFLLDHDGLTPGELADLVYRRGGLLGVSGESGDVRDLLASPTPAAADALALFCYRATRELGGLAAALGGVDSLVFTGGVGAGSPEVRSRIAAGAAWLGVELDEAANVAGRPRLHGVNSRVAVWAIPSDEEAVIARHTNRLVHISETAP